MDGRLGLLPVEWQQKEDAFKGSIELYKTGVQK
jgi:hypothetical protein